MAAFTLAHLSDPHLPPLPAARLARSRGQARARLSQLDPQPPQIPPARGARRAGRRHAGAAAGPHRGHRRSRQSGAGSRVRAGAGLAGKRRPAASTSPSFPAITTPMSAPPNTASPAAFGDYLRGDAEANGTPFPFLRRRGPLALIGVSSAVPTLAADGDGQARPRAARCAGSDAGATCRPNRRSACCWCIIPCIRTSRDQAADGFAATARAVEAARRRAGAARARPHPFDDVVRRHRTARSPRSACRRPRRSRTGIIRPRPTICFRSSATAIDGAASRPCAASRMTCGFAQIRQTTRWPRDCARPRTARGRTSAAAPSRNPSTNVPKRAAARLLLQRPARPSGVATIACSRSIMRRAT